MRKSRVALPIFLLAAALGFGGVAAAQEIAIPEVDFPDLPDAAADAEGFVPGGWRLETAARGDLDGDKADDLVLVLRQDDPDNIIRHDALGENPFDSNPRILAVAFDAGGNFELAVANHTLITRRTDPVLDDVLAETGGVAIDRGSVVVSLHLFASAGGSDTGTRSFRFRHRAGRFALIGFDETMVNRMSGEMLTTSINYLTGKVQEVTGSIENDKTVTVWKKIGRGPLKDIDAVGDGMEFIPYE